MTILKLKAMNFKTLLILLVLAGCASQKHISADYEARMAQLMQEKEFQIEEINLARQQNEVLRQNLMERDVMVAEQNKQLEELSKTMAEPLPNPMVNNNDSIVEAFQRLERRYLSDLQTTELNLQALRTESKGLSEDRELLREHLTELGANEFDGKLLINCPTTMTETVPETINAVITSYLNRTQIVETIASSQNLTLEEADAGTSVFRVVLTNKIRLTLEFSKDDFELLGGQQGYERTLHPDKEEWFNWSIKPLRPGAGKRLVFVLENLNTNGEWSQRIPPQRREIEVKIKPGNFFINIWTFSQANPQWTMTAMVFPVITFLVGYWKSKRKGTDDMPKTV